jgi:histidinol-phosphate phosphatase family protein
MLRLSQIKKDWTLFLDRDGVINYEKPGDYIYSWSEFVFYEGAREALAGLSRIFGTLIITTNQRGVGKGLMSVDDLEDVHLKMVREIENAGGKIDRIYYCLALENSDPCRKPNPGMAYQAKRDFPDIDFARSIMVGNTLSDMEFGRNAGMYTVHLTTTHPDTGMPHSNIDLQYPDLRSFAKALEKR